MLEIPRIIGEIVVDYIQSAEEANREYRLVIPGLTKNISMDLHSYLLSNGVNSYLIVGDDVQPDEGRRWIRPTGLTSKRIGSFVTVAEPGQLVSIQDSIRGAGGTIRSQAFSEEWPWIDNGSETFRFDGSVLDRMLKEWGAQQEEKQWLWNFIKKGLIRATRNYTCRAELMLEDILGGFKPDSYNDIEDLRTKFLFHVGIPCQNQGIPSAEELIRDCTKLCQQVVERCQGEDGIREYISNEMIPEIINDVHKQSEVRESVNILLDGLGSSRTQKVDLLAFHSCWGVDPLDKSHWFRLDAELLAKLFDVKGRNTSNIACELSCDRGIVSVNGKKIATFHGEKVKIAAAYNMPTEIFDQGSWEVILLSRNNRITSSSVQTAKGEIELLLDTFDIRGNLTNNIPLKLVLGRKGNVLADFRFYISLCGKQRPAFIIIEPGFDITNASKVDDETADKKIEISEPVYVYLFDYKNSTSPEIYDDNYKKVDIDYVIQGIYRSSRRIDPTIEASGQTILRCHFDDGNLKAIVSLEAKDMDKGEFTIEDELRVQLVEGSGDGRIKELVKIFSGEKSDLYPYLGKINDASRQKSVLASVVTRSEGWKPLLLNLINPECDKPEEIGDYINCLGPVNGTGFQGISFPDKALELLRRYSEIRKSILQMIEGSISGQYSQLQNPIYATHPIFIHDKSKEMEEHLVGYLNCYLEILDFLKNEYRDLTWTQCFVLSYLDCVVHWDNSEIKNALLLIGPWHPMVLAKRFMVQAALYARAKRFIDDKSGGKEFRQLSALLERVTGFRWFAGLSPNDILFEPIYVAATSDPAWHFAFKTNIEGLVVGSEAVNLADICNNLNINLDLNPDVLSSGTENLASSSLSSYVRAFPSRRSVGLSICPGYSVEKIVHSIDNFLHSEEGPTNGGLKLPGGIRLYLQDQMNYVDDIQWFGPPFAVYNYRSNAQNISEDYPDIYMLPLEHTLTFNRENDEQEIPRGNLMESVFSQPIQFITEGQSQIPVSKNCEYQVEPKAESDGSLGSTFVKAAARLCNLNNDLMATMRSIKLPSQIGCPWAIVPGGGLDPAMLVKYVRDGISRSIQERALWDYSVNLSSQGNAYYILSSIPKSYQVIVNGAFGRDDVANDFINELGKVGIAIGGEALKSGRNALGVIGLVGAVRLFVQQGTTSNAPLSYDEKQVGFLIPVDSFASFFGSADTHNDQGAKRTDLLAIQLVLPSSANDFLTVYACGIESKYVSTTFSESDSQAALAQAKATSVDFCKLILKSLQDGSMPERLGLLSLIKFGLRISSPSTQGEVKKWSDIEKKVYNAILQKRYRYFESKYKAILVSTEMGLPGVADFHKHSDSLWVRINKEHWPGVSDTVHIERVRKELLTLFTEGYASTGVVQNAIEHDNKPNSSLSYGNQEITDDLTSKIEAEPINVNVEQNNNEGEAQVGAIAGVGKPLSQIMVGVDDGRRKIYYDPQSLVAPLDNLNIMVTGSSGTGKTQFIKYLMCQLRNQQKNVLTLDFKDDFASDRYFIKKAKLSSVFVAFDGLPYNPLIPYPVKHPGTGEKYIQCGHHIAGVTSVLRRTYGLGPQQQAAVKKAISDAFTLRGIPTTGSSRFDETMVFPDLSNVGNALRSDNPAAYNRLDPLFTLGLFKDEYRDASFHSLVNHSAVIDLSQIASDEIKNALAQLMVMSAHAYYNSQPHSGNIRQIFVFDEAHRVLDSDYMLKLVRECRAYGVGALLSSQYPSDFPQEISASMAFKVMHSNGRDIDRVKDIVRSLGCEGKEAVVSNLDMFQAIIDNRHNPHTVIRTMNYPLYIVYCLLHNRTVLNGNEIYQLEGLDTSKLSVNNLIRQLERLGFAEERDGQIFLLGQIE